MRFTCIITNLHHRYLHKGNRSSRWSFLELFPLKTFVNEKLYLLLRNFCSRAVLKAQALYMLITWVTTNRKKLQNLTAFKKKLQGHDLVFLITKSESIKIWDLRVKIKSMTANQIRMREKKKM